MKKICVYTCITGNYDDLHELEIIEKNVDYICFTNNKNIKSNTWKIIYIDDSTIDNHKLARKIKIIGHPYIDKNYDISVWMDAGVVFRKKVTDFVKEFLKDKSIAFFKHYCRDCVYDEAIACTKKRKDSKENILKIINYLKKENYPEHNGLFETTVFIKKHNDPIVKQTMCMWFDFIKDYTKRDQLSINYCTWKNKLDVSIIDLVVWDNEWFYNIKHNYKTEVTDCRIYYGDEDNNYNYDLDEVKKYNIKDNTYSFKSKVIEDTKVIKIDVCDAPCIKYSNIDIKGLNILNMEVKNSIDFMHDKIFFSDNGVIILNGNFKKNQEYTFKIDFNRITDSRIIQMLEQTCKSVILLNEKIDEIQKEKDKLKNKKGLFSFFKRK